MRRLALLAVLAFSVSADALDPGEASAATVEVLSPVGSQVFRQDVRWPDGFLNAPGLAGGSCGGSDGNFGCVRIRFRADGCPSTYEAQVRSVDFAFGDSGLTGFMDTGQGDAAGIVLGFLPDRPLPSVFSWYLQLRCDSVDGSEGQLATSPVEETQIEPCQSKRTGKGYDGLTDEMKERLQRLYDRLDARRGCYVFNSGYRSPASQKEIYDDWHERADRRGEDDDRSFEEVCDDIADSPRNFLQSCPSKRNGKWWNSEGVAYGGPAKSSRHTLGQAADLGPCTQGKAKSCVWMVGALGYRRSLTLLRREARAAGLCGPPSGDPGHVELPYRKPLKRKRGKGKKLGPLRCHFPPGPAP